MHNNFGTAPTGASTPPQPPVNQFGSPQTTFGQAPSAYGQQGGFTPPVNQFGNVQAPSFGGPGAPAGPGPMQGMPVKTGSTKSAKGILGLLGTLVALVVLGVRAFSFFSGPPELPETLATLPKTETGPAVTVADLAVRALERENPRAKVDSAVYEGNGVVMIAITADMKAADINELGNAFGGARTKSEVNKSTCAAGEEAVVCMRTGWGKTTMVLGLNTTDLNAIAKANSDLYG